MAGARFLRSILLWPLLAVVAFAAVAAGGVWAAGEGAPAGSPVHPWPGECIADTPTMRRDHMDMIRHQRDLTVHGGQRPADRGLTACVTCHAVKGDDGMPVTVADSRHFCRTCHDTAAVRIDCFTCHTSTPGAPK